MLRENFQLAIQFSVCRAFTSEKNRRHSAAAEKTPNYIEKKQQY